MNEDIYSMLSLEISAKEIPQEMNRINVLRNSSIQGLKSNKLFDTLSAKELSGNTAMLKSVTAPKPTILLNKIPIVLDSKDYEDPLSTANPNGNLISLWRFRQLVDPIPQFSNVYIPSSNSSEMYYTQIVEGAIPSDAGSFASMVIGNAKKEIVAQTFANMDGTQGRWCPVYAVPDDWYDLSKMNTQKQLNLDLSQLTTSNDSSDSGSPLRWKISEKNNSTSEISLDKNSNINSAKVSYQMVNITRPWFNSMLFETNGWYLEGQNAGFCSSGKNDGKGVIPVIPTSVIIGTGVNINANWSDQDKKIIKDAQDMNQQLSLGPLLVNEQQNNNQLYVLGWVISLIPFSPQVNS